MIVSSPCDSISIDLLRLLLMQNGSHYILECIDSYHRFSVPVPFKDKSAHSVVKGVIDNIICPYGAPHVLRFNTGSRFNNTLLQMIYQKFHIKKCNIVRHSRSSNGKVERCNKCILNVVRHTMDSKSSGKHDP